MPDPVQSPDDEKTPPAPTADRVEAARAADTARRDAATRRDIHATELTVEAIKGRNGELKEPIPVYKDKKIPTGNYARVVDGQFSNMFTGGWWTPWSGGIAQNFNSRVSVKMVPETVTRTVQAGVRPHNVIYPSPSEASHSEVLEQFYKANLTMTDVPYVDDAGVVPALTARVMHARLAANGQPHDAKLAAAVGGERGRAEAVFNYIANSERDYVKKINEDIAWLTEQTGRPITPNEQKQIKDNVALATMTGMIQDSHRNSTLANKNTLNPIPDPANMVLALATGNGIDASYGQTTYNGSFGQMINYVDAVKRNSREAVYTIEGAVDRSDAFKLADHPEYQPGKHLSPGTVPTPAEDKTLRIKKLQDALALYESKVHVRVGESPNGVMSPSVIRASIQAVINDAADGTLNNQPDLYRGDPINGIAMPISSLLSMSNGITYSGAPPEGEVKKSVDAVVKAFTGGLQDKTDVLGHIAQIDQGLPVPLNRVELTDGVVDQLIDATQYLAEQQGKAPHTPRPPRAPAGSTMRRAGK